MTPVIVALIGSLTASIEFNGSVMDASRTAATRVDAPVISAEAALAALLVNDRAIRSVRATQRFTMHMPDGSSRTWRDGSEGFDSFGGWCFEGLNFEWTGAADGPIVRHAEMFRDGRHRVWTWVPSTRQGLCRPVDGEEGMPASIWNNLGRTMRSRAAGSLGEHMERAEDLHVSQVEVGGDSVLVTLSGLCDFWVHVAWVDAEIDLARGGAVVGIEMRDPLLGYVFDRWRSTELREIDGVWIPTAGWREGFSRAGPWPSEPRRGYLQKLKDAGLPEVLDPRNALHRAASAEALREFFPDGVPGVQQMGVRTSFIATDIEVNDGIDRGRAAITYEAPGVLYDVFLGVSVPIDDDATASRLRREQLDASQVIGSPTSGRPIDPVPWSGTKHHEGGAR
jgi:hypothetical protein